MDDVTVEEGAKAFSAVIDSDVIIRKNATVGIPNASKDKIVVIAKGTVIPENTVIES